MAVRTTEQMAARRTPEAHNRFRVYRQKLKQEVIEHYGGQCACCGETEIIFLGLDHVDGGGTSERKKVGAGYTYYLQVRKLWPDGLQVLCHNCNFAKHFDPNGCPHKRSE